MPEKTTATYIMGRTERERRRLQLQGSILGPLTERLFQTAGIWSGMRVLDLGCGIGDLSLMAARITGSDGHVIGIDVDDAALDIARLRAAGCHHVAFEHADFAHYNPDRPLDAVVGRHVLIHTADPLSLIRRVVSWLRPGGIAAFQEYDLSLYPAGYPQAPLIDSLERAMVEFFRKATPHANIGMRLYRLMREAGLSKPQSWADCLIDGGPVSPFYEWFAETVRSILPGMEAFGLATMVGDPDTLAERLREETVTAGACVTSPLIVSAFATRP